MKQPQYSLAILGGDKRQVMLAESFAAEGHSVTTAGLEQAGPIPGVTMAAPEEAIQGADCILLPVPATKDQVHIFAPLSTFPISLGILKSVGNRLVLGGALPPEDKKGVNYVNYSARADFKGRNAIPSAEAAIALAVGETGRTLHGTPILIIGYGAIGKALAKDLSGLGAHVTVTARKATDFAIADGLNIDARATARLKNYVNHFCLIFNTVPAPVLTSDILERCRPDAVILDLASAPGGTDFIAAKALGLKATLALGLPGKTAPVTAAEICKKTIETIWEERL